MTRTKGFIEREESDLVCSGPWDGTRFVLTLGDDGGCDDPACCGGASYHIEAKSVDLDHLVACWNAVEKIGGDPADVERLAKALAELVRYVANGILSENGRTRADVFETVDQILKKASL